MKSQPSETIAILNLASDFCDRIMLLKRVALTLSKSKE